MNTLRTHQYPGIVLLNKPNHVTKFCDSLILSCTNSYSVLGSVSSIASQASSVLSTQDTSVDAYIIGSPKATSPQKPSVTKANEPPKRSSNRNIRVICVNFQSIKNKAPELRVLLESANPDILIGCETWTNQSMFSSESIPDDYGVRRRDRGMDDHGVVLIDTKKDLVTAEIHVINEAELLTIKFDLPRQKSLVATAYYMPPNKIDDMYMETTVKEITETRNQNKN